MLHAENQKKKKKVMRNPVLSGVTKLRGVMIGWVAPMDGKIIARAPRRDKAKEAPEINGFLGLAASACYSPIRNKQDSFPPRRPSVLLEFWYVFCDGKANSTYQDAGIRVECCILAPRWLPTPGQEPADEPRSKTNAHKSWCISRSCSQSRAGCSLIRT